MTDYVKPYDPSRKRDRSTIYCDGLRRALAVLADCNIGPIEIVLPWNAWAAVKEQLGEHAKKPTDAMVLCLFEPWLFEMMGPFGPVLVIGRE